MLKLEKVNKYFNHRKKNEIHVINNTTLEFPSKGLVALLGPSGCGKTTLLNVIGGLDKVNKGKIYINDKKITRKCSNFIDKTRNLNIGYIFQNYNLLDNQTVYDNVAISLKMSGIKNKDEIKKRVNYVLETLGIYRYRNRIASMLSGGERQRVGIARAIVKNPNIILADEPTGNLDSANTIEIMNIIKSISKNRLVILVTHENDLAKFYADRIIELEDGIIKNDYQNEHNDDLDYHIDNKLYLKDFKHNYNLEDNNNTINIYNDEDEKITLTVVVKKGNIYIKGQKNSKIEVVDDSSKIEFIDDHYKKIDKTIYEKYEFDFDNVIDKNIKLKYTSIVNPFTLFFQGINKIRDYSFIKKLLLLGFVISGFFITYCIFSIFGINNINDKDFVEKNHNYYDVETVKVSQEKYQNINNLASVDYALPGTSVVDFSMPVDDYYQSINASVTLTGSIVSSDYLTSDDIVYGRLPENKYEIVIDEMVISDTVKDTGIQIGLSSSEDYLNRVVKLMRMKDFTIVGIVSKNDPSIYIDRSILMHTIYNSTDSGTIFEDSEPGLRDYSLEDNLVLKKGNLPANDYEVLVNIENESLYPLNKTIDFKVNGKKLTVVGYYENKEINDYYVNTNTITYTVLSNNQNLTVMPKDETNLVSEINSLSLDATKSYDVSLYNYKTTRAETVKSTVIVSSIFLVISFVEIYLIVRSSFLTRIKEVGIYRAIGVKKSDICKMFYGEILAITTLGSVPGSLFCYYVFHILSSISYFQNNYLVNIYTVLLSIIIIYVFNIIIGLLPVMRVLMQTPAQILARKDLD